MVNCFMIYVLLSMVYGLWSMFLGLLSIVYVVWSLFYGLCFMVYGQLLYCLYAMINVLWSMFYDIWSMFYGLCAMIIVLWSMFYGIWSMFFVLLSTCYDHCSMVSVLWPVCSMFWSLDCLMFLLIYIPHLIFLLGVLRKHFCKNFIKWDFPQKRILSLVTFSYICSVKQFEKIRNKWFHRNPNIPNLSGVFI